MKRFFMPKHDVVVPSTVVPTPTEFLTSESVETTSLSIITEISEEENKTIYNLLLRAGDNDVVLWVIVGFIAGSFFMIMISHRQGNYLKIELFNLSKATFRYFVFMKILLNTTDLVILLSKFKQNN